jgi:TfoX/Sxy family transcriptional regulator of competence genes
VAYSEVDAVRMRKALQRLRGVSEKRMFGGICFLLRDHMLAGVGQPGFMFRVGKEQEEEALRRRGTSPMEFKGRRLHGLLWVDARRCSDRELRGWVTMARRFIATLPPKKRGARKARRPRRR